MKNIAKNTKSVQMLRTAGKAALFATFALAPMIALAGNGYEGTDAKVEGFLDNITGLLGLASIAVVTIAIIFAGYQIAFNHKRISDVAPILVGGLLIGAAGQIASMVIGKDTTETTMLLINSLAPFYA
ncbi:TrbC/VirB2 family protein [Lysobacter sp.]|uniref:TrbC/VirB2 family protein n=1 Tax=Lysobacter sp. TaxID=72226 RepID=UPI002D65A314|nr:TrbC/VirB2 family protein [Lysobacter sp.]HZX78965.1 TrbC/VirB2 family protein [Lysobacter sp.]